jgi:radical SAM superfamily enzyme YgiQ (UPF0313 family)
MNNGTYRAREPEMVIDEIRTVVEAYREALRSPIERGRGVAKEIHNMVKGYQPIPNTLQNSRSRWLGEIRSILFDDDTWNLGPRRIHALCQGLKDIGLPWTMMGRIDTASLPLYDLMVECGCVGMRFGVESFNQQLLDNAKKRLDARVSFENIKYLLQRFTGLEFHFTTMRNLPGATEEDHERDDALLSELRAIGEASGNRVHWQVSECVPFPGTELWDQLVEFGKREELSNFEMYDGSTVNNQSLAKAVGWLGNDYQATWSEYSKDGRPSGLPEE